ncbi:MAG: ribonuclease R [Geminicoccaceae bacterium]|nr:ribonuclease R [Geminicoccaceae bacterium]
MARGKGRATVPSPAELLELLHDRGGRVSARDLARELGLSGDARAELKHRLRQLERPNARRAPSMIFCEVSEIDEDGEIWAESATLPGAAILIRSDRPGAAPTLGDRLLARPERQEDGLIVGHLFKLLPRAPREMVGQLEKTAHGLVLVPSRKDQKRELPVVPGEVEADAGDIVRVTLEHGRPLEPPRARIVERIGRADEPRAISMALAIELELPMEFSPQALDEAAAAEPVELEGRDDLRDVDLVTIDGADARDFDDAVWAAADNAADNPGGFRAIVAIADVAHYVRDGSALDHDARERGNSVYFPDRVIPMLPEALSNELCSLKPEVERACLACHMRFDAGGQLFDWHFSRALMRSRARLTYEQAQRARDGDPQAAPLSIIEPLYALYDKLAEARQRRGTIELDLPERVVDITPEGRIRGITARQRLPSHMLIEEMMIAANVAAARTLADRRVPCLYRVHDKPDAVKLENLAQYLENLGIGWSRNAHKPADFTRLLNRIEEPALREQVSSLVLRSQAQAIYSPENIGHFGLNLRRYAHFTSPIRRYSDLVVHRLLIEHLDLFGQESGRPYEFEDLKVLGEDVSGCERKAVDAERRAQARYVALYMEDRVGARFAGRVGSVQRFGLFVTLDDTGAEGLVPVSTLGDDMFVHDERHHALVGERHGEIFAMGDKVTVTLSEVDTNKGMLSFRIEEHRPGHVAEIARRAWKKGGSRLARRGHHRHRGSRPGGRHRRG